MSFSNALGSSPANKGTATVRLAPYAEYSGSALDQYQTISAQQECADFSLEELRLADYEQGHAISDKQKNLVPAEPCTRAWKILPRTDDKRRSNHLDLLIGPAIEIKVGAAISMRGSADISVTWSLPKRLISYHSPFLAAACDRDFKERHENLINLPDEDPIVFALFVEWLYYGAYGIEPLSKPSHTRDDGICIDAECWVLGDKLLCNNFKNYAMRRLHQQHTAKIFARSITTHDVQFACDHSAQASKLRELYVDLAATNYGRLGRSEGTPEEWEKLFLTQSDLRRLFLRSLRLEDKERMFVKSEEHYLEDGDVSP